MFSQGVFAPRVCFDGYTVCPPPMTNIKFVLKANDVFNPMTVH